MYMHRTLWNQFWHNYLFSIKLFEFNLVKLEMSDSAGSSSFNSGNVLVQDCLADQQNEEKSFEIQFIANDTGENIGVSFTIS